MFTNIIWLLSQSPINSSNLMTYQLSCDDSNWKLNLVISLGSIYFTIPYDKENEVLKKTAFGEAPLKLHYYQVTRYLWLSRKDLKYKNYLYEVFLYFYIFTDIRRRPESKNV